MVHAVSGINGELAVLEALAAGADTGKSSNDLAQLEEESGNLLKAIEQQIAQYGNNLTAIEDFIAAFIASKTGCNVSGGEGQVVDQLQTLLGTLKADDNKIGPDRNQIDKDN